MSARPKRPRRKLTVERANKLNRQLDQKFGAPDYEEDRFRVLPEREGTERHYAGLRTKEYEAVVAGAKQ